MPILAYLPDDPGPVDPGDPGTPPALLRTRIAAIWTPPYGDAITLTDCSGGIDWLTGRSGEDMPPFEWTEDENVDYDGSVIRGVRATPRTLTLPILLKVEGPFTQWRPLHQRFLKALNPLRDDGVMTYVMPDGSSRQLFCRYKQGAEGDAIRDPRGLWWRVYATQWRAVDPYWYATTPQTVQWGVPEAGSFFPILPVQLTSSRVIGDATLDLAGDVPTYGVWTITGPAAGVATLRSVTLGRTVSLNLTGAYELGAGESVTVDMRPGRVSITGPDGPDDNWWPARAGLPQPFSLEPGLNNLQIAVAGATTATQVTLVYQPKWFSA